MRLWIGLLVFVVAAAIGGAYASHVFDEWCLRNVMPEERSNFRRKSRTMVCVFAVMTGLAALFVMSIWPE